MKKSIFVLFIPIIVFGMFYITFALINWQVNPGNWGNDARGWCFGMSLGITMLLELFLWIDYD
jgi:hypothetical protein